MAHIISMPQLSDTMEEGRILHWHKAEGEEVEPGDILAEIESDKADVEFEVFRKGVLRKILVPEGEIAPVGAPIAIIAERQEDIAEALAEAEEAARALEVARVETVSKEPEVASAPAEAEAAPAPKPSEGRILASPVALRLASELGVDLSQVRGTGPGGRIVKRDVEAAARAPAPAAPPADAPVVAEVAREPVEGDFEDVPLSSVRKAIARRLVESKAPVPHFYVTMDVEMGPALEAKQSLERLRGLKATVTDLLIRACGLALAKHPQINSSFLGDSIRRYRRAHIGVVVATEEGLVIPVIRDAQEKGLADIASERADLVGRARQRRLKPEEFTGATFTISNLGMFGVDSFSAVIAPPEGAILAVGAVRERPVAREGRLDVGLVMTMTLACDHRVIDGVEAAAFLGEVKELLEKPAALVL
jgi:pyruvate dehydrogenase E2 component (dihydrolipoamide acetyltransferase)